VSVRIDFGGNAAFTVRFQPGLRSHCVTPPNFNRVNQMPLRNGVTLKAQASAPRYR
jgi:hypothetical protein